MKFTKREAVMGLIIIILALVIWDNRTSIFGMDGSSDNDSKSARVEVAPDIYEVVRVVDGDTVILDIDGKDERVRLTGLNTPEAKEINGRVVECFGEAASKKAKELLQSGTTVRFEGDETTTRDQYGRLLGYIFIQNKQGLYEDNFSELMIESGYGYEYTYQGRSYKYQSEFKVAQKTAEKNKVGLWASGACQ